MIGMTPAWLTFSGRILPGAAEDPPAAHVLGRLGRDPPLALGDGDDPDHDRDEQAQEQEDA